MRQRSQRQVLSQKPHAIVHATITIMVPHLPKSKFQAKRTVPKEANGVGSIPNRVIALTCVRNVAQTIKPSKGLATKIQSKVQACMRECPNGAKINQTMGCVGKSIANHTIVGAKCQGCLRSWSKTFKTNLPGVAKGLRKILVSDSKGWWLGNAKITQKMPRIGWPICPSCWLKAVN
jgi:CO dehydrogenase/acetyl-CoA synthase alpha subunit